VYVTAAITPVIAMSMDAMNP